MFISFGRQGLRRASPLATVALLFALEGCCDPVILTDNLPDGRVGEMYLFAVESECGFGFWSVSGELPPGLSFTSEGVFIGTPSVAGFFLVTLTWEDRDSEERVIMSVSKGFLLVILEADASESVEDGSVFDLS